MSSRPAWVLPISFLALTVTTAGCSGGAGGTPLRFNPKLNTPYVYRTDVNTLEMNASNTTWTTSTVYTSKGSGGFEGVSTITDATGPDSSLGSQIKGTQTTKEINDRGEITSSNGPGPLADLQSLSGISSGAQGVVFPVEGLHNGQTWISSFNLGKAGQAIHMTGSDLGMKFTVVAITGDTVTIEGITSALVQFAGTTASMDGHSTFDFSRTDGMLLKSIQKIHTKMTGPVNIDTETDTTITKQ